MNTKLILFACAAGAAICSAADFSDFSVEVGRCPGTGSSHFDLARTNYAPPQRVFWTTNAGPFDLGSGRTLIQHRDDTISPEGCTVFLRFPDICAQHVIEWAALKVILEGANTNGTFNLVKTGTVPTKMTGASWLCYPSTFIYGPSLEVVRYGMQPPPRTGWDEFLENMRPAIKFPPPINTPPFRPFDPNNRARLETVTCPGVTLVVQSASDPAAPTWSYETTVTTDEYGYAETGELTSNFDQTFYRVTCYTNSP